MCANYVFDGAYRGQQISLTFDVRAFEAPDCVLVFPFVDMGLLLTHHKIRGWELPGGSIQTGESAKMAARRETMEETGAIINYLEPFGQYQIIEANKRSVKTIFFAYVGAIHPIPDGFETDGIEILLTPPSPEELLKRVDVSPIMKDGVYRYSLPIALDLYARWRRENDTKANLS